MLAPCASPEGDGVGREERKEGEEEGGREDKEEKRDGGINSE